MREPLIRWLVLFTTAIFHLAHPLAAAAETGGLKRYSDARFHFEYPADAGVTVSPDRTFIDIRVSQQSGLTLTIDTPSVDDYPECKPNDTFFSCYITLRAELHCDADSSEGTEYCLNEDVSKERVSIGGKTGYRFHLTRTREVYASKTKTKYQDTQLLYYFEIQSGKPKHRGRQTLEDLSSPHLQILEINGTNDDAVKKILNTLRFD